MIYKPREVKKPDKETSASPILNMGFINLGRLKKSDKETSACEALVSLSDVFYLSRFINPIFKIVKYGIDKPREVKKI